MWCFEDNHLVDYPPAKVLGRRDEDKEKFFYISQINGVWEKCILELNDIQRIEKKGRLRICSVSDTHSRHEDIGVFPNEIDLFVLCGDFLLSNRKMCYDCSLEKLKEFNIWLGKINASHKIVIAGNHDFVVPIIGKEKMKEILSNVTYLENEFIRVCNLNIFGSPASQGTSPNQSFQSDEFVYSSKQMALDCNEEIDILISHEDLPHVFGEVKINYIHLWGHHHAQSGIKSGVKYGNSNNNEVLSLCSCVMDDDFCFVNHPYIIDISIP